MADAAAPNAAASAAAAIDRALAAATPADVAAGRRSPEALAAAIADAAPRLARGQALVEAERCLYCWDAPCQQACPTGIDVPGFIRRIADDNLRGAARTILSANPFGGTCARACPTEVLCEQVCVRNLQQGKPVEIGRLQRYATDAVMSRPVTALFSRAAATGRRIAVVGAGPAGLTCAFELARRGHEVVVHDLRDLPGGLNEYGLATYKMAGDFAQAEAAWLLGIGGIGWQPGWELETAAQLAELRASFDAVYLAVGLAGTHRLGIDGESLHGVHDAVAFIATLRQAKTPEALARLAVGRRVVVIGGGMTAVDVAVQSRLLGAERVDIVYRRGPEKMGASAAEREWAQKNGVTIHFGLAPLAIDGHGGHASAVRFLPHPGGGDAVRFEADQVFKAIGQKLDESVLASSGLTLLDGRVVTDANGHTGVPHLYAGGDCRAGGRDLTVEAVEDGKRAAAAIHQELLP